MSVRIGIDVGGTFTKAAVIDAASGELLEKATVPTTYDERHGVAPGVVAAFQSALAGVRAHGRTVESVVLSTTQAVNALLEGDVASVGVVGLAGRARQRDAQKRTRLGPIRLSESGVLPVVSSFLSFDSLDDAAADAAVSSLLERGAQAVVASAAYAVEDPEPERIVLRAAARQGVPATGGHEMTGLYGLEVRTFTAAINASILPRMMRVLRWVEESMREADLRAPIMVMHGDLDVVSLDEALLHPAPSILSGPAASVAGASLYHRVADGLFMEVGGTSTNIGAVRNSRPGMKYVTIMDHPTSLRSVDVRVAAVGGGSMVRLRRGKIADVGPRSAHVAGLPYPSFSPPEALAGARLVAVSPRPGDPADYVAVETDGGERFAVTLTDAANALGEIAEGDYAHGSQETARLALAPLASHIGMSTEALAREMLHRGARKVVRQLKDLSRDYGLRERSVLGLGGAASVLVPAASRALGAGHRIVPHAEVISSIGAAVTPVGVEMERTLADDDPDLLCRLLEHAKERAAEVGANPASVWVTVEPVPERSAVRLRALGTTGSADGGSGRWLDDAQARRLAAEVLRERPDALMPVFQNRFFRVFLAEKAARFGPWRRRRLAVAVVDPQGAVRFAARDSAWESCAPAEAPGVLARLARPGAGVLAAPPRLAVLSGSHLVVVPHGQAASLECLVRGLQPSADGNPVALLAAYSDVVA